MRYMSTAGNKVINGLLLLAQCAMVLGSIPLPDIFNNRNLQTTQCPQASFPKVLGVSNPSTGSQLIYHAKTDQLAYSGTTLAQRLNQGTGTTQTGIICLFKGNQKTHAWSKYSSQTLNTYGISFNPVGDKLAVTTGTFSIYVLYASDGSVFAAVSTGLDAQYDAYKIILVSSSDSAFVNMHKNSDKSVILCINMNTKSQLWETSASNANNKGLGVSFGEDESVLYHLSIKSSDNNLLLHRIKTADGQIQWSQLVSTSYPSSLNLETFRDSSTSSYVYVAGSITNVFIYRYKIESGSVTSRDTFFETTNNGLILTALQIIDKDTLSALFYSPSFDGHSNQIVLGKFSLSDKTVDYQRLLPQYDGTPARIQAIVSSKKYYFLYTGTQIQQSPSSPQTLAGQSIVILSSDSTESCQETSQASLIKTLTHLSDTPTALTTSGFSSSTNLASISSQTVSLSNVQVSQSTKIDSWCTVTPSFKQTLSNLVVSKDCIAITDVNAALTCSSTTISVLDQTNANPTFAKVDQTSGTIGWKPTSPSQAESFTMTVSLGASTQTSTFKLEVKDNQFSIPAETQTFYQMVGDPSQTQNLKKQTGDVPSCGAFTQTVVFTPFPQTVASFDKSSFVLTIDAPTGTTAGTIDLKITSELVIKTPTNTLGLASTLTGDKKENKYTIIVVDGLVSKITPSAIQDIFYVIKDPALTFTLPSFANSDTQLPITYLLQQQDGSSLNSQVLSFNPADLSLKVESSDESLYGTFMDMALIAHYTPFPQHKVSQNFKIYLLSPCSRNVITPPVESYQLIYNISQPMVSLVFATWTINMSECGPLRYQISPGYGALSSFLSFTEENRTISVFTKDPQSHGIYAVQLSATTFFCNQELSVTQITIPVIVSCTPLSIATYATIQDQTVVISSQKKSVTFGSFSIEPQCKQAKIIYSYTSSMPESFLTLKGDSRTFIIDPSKIINPGIYVITVIGSAGIATTEFQWRITALKPQISGSLLGGSIKLPALSFTIPVGRVSIITSPSFQDILAISSYQYIADPNAVQFSSFSDMQLSLKPGNEDGGKYTFYFFANIGTVTYLQAINAIVTGGSQPSNYIGAVISKIGPTGEVLLTFDSSIFNYQNVSNIINDTILEVKAPTVKSNMTWRAVDYPQSETLRLQLTFSDPASVSTKVRNLNPHSVDY